MKLNLKRPLAFFDLEATGLNIGVDRIVEIAILKAMPDGSTDTYTQRINPEMPIPLESSLIHGIYDADVQDKPNFKSVAPVIIDFIGDADLAGYNSNKFDIPFLVEEFLRVGIDFDMNGRFFIDVQNIFHQMEQRTLKAAYKFYCDADLINAHSAEADIVATYEVLLAQLERYKDTEFINKNGEISKPVVNEVSDLHNFTNINNPVDFAGRMVYNENNEPCFNFGKHKGRRVLDVFSSEPSYYAWMKQGDFPLYTKKKLDELWNEFNENKGNSKSELVQKNTNPKVYSKPHKVQRNPKNEKVVPVTNDMLDQLKMKFGK